MIAADGLPWGSRPASSASDFTGNPYQQRGDFGRGLSLGRTNSAVDMRQLTTALLEAREGSGEVRSALLRAAFRPRLPGLTKIVSKLAKEGSWRKALEVYEAVEELGLRPDTALTNSAISACDKGGRWQKALEIFDRMEAARLPRDAITYSATISSLAKGKQWHAALQVFDHMQAAGVEADVVTCCSLINALERGGQWQLAEKLFLQMCTVQEDDANPLAHMQLLPTSSEMHFLPPDLVASTLARSHTSPTSVLLNSLRPGNAAATAASQGGGLPPVDESSAITSASPRLASLGILNAVAQQTSSQVGSEDNKGSTEDESSVHSGVAALQQQQQQQQQDAPSAMGSNPASFDGMNGLASAFARATSISPSHSLDFSDRPQSAGTGFNLPVSLFAGSFNGNAAPGGGNGGPPRMSSTLFRSASTTQSMFQQIPEAHELALAPPPSPSSQQTGQAPPSRLQRAGSLRRGNSDPYQAAAAAHLRRAMSCFPDVDSAEAPASGGLASMFNFSHAARITPNRVCCNALLAAYARAKPPQWQKALHLLAAMWAGGPALAPDPVSYNTVIKACSNAFQLGRAVETYREMISRGIPANATTFNCLIAAAADSGSGPTLRDLGTCLDVAPPEVRAACMNGYVSGLAKAGAWEDARLRFQEMLTPGSPAHPTAATFNVIMTGQMHAGDYQAVIRTFDDMRSSAVTPTIVAYNTVLAAQAALGAWAEALDMLNIVLAAAGEGVHANTTTFNTVLAALSRGIASLPPEQHELVAGRAVQIYQHMSSIGGAATPDSTTYASLIDILNATNHHAQVVAVFEIMSSAGTTPTAPTAAAIVKAAIAIGQPSRAVPMVASMVLQSRNVDPEVLTSLLASCTDTKAWEAASQLCSAAQVSQGPGAAAAMYNFVLDGALSSQQYGVAMNLLSLMQSAGMDVDASVAGKLLGPSTDASSPHPHSGSETSHHDLGSPRRQGSGGSASVTDDAPLATTSASVAGTKAATMGSHVDKTALPTTPNLESSPGAQLSPDSDGPVGPAEPQHGPSLTLVDTNEMLAQLSNERNGYACVEVLTHMKLAKITPDAQSYRHVVHALAASGDAKRAMDFVREGHAAGALRHFVLPGGLSGVQSDAHKDAAAALTLDVTGCTLETAIAMLTAWLSTLAHLRNSGVEMEPAALKISMSHARNYAGNDTKVDSQGLPQVEAELKRLVTTGSCCLAHFAGSLPLLVSKSAVTSVIHQDGSFCLELPAEAIFTS